MGSYGEAFSCQRGTPVWHRHHQRVGIAAPGVLDRDWLGAGRGSAGEGQDAYPEAHGLEILLLDETCTAPIERPESLLQLAPVDLPRGNRQDLSVILSRPCLAVCVWQSFPGSLGLFLCVFFVCWPVEVSNLHGRVFGLVPGGHISEWWLALDSEDGNNSLVNACCTGHRTTRNDGGTWILFSRRCGSFSSCLRAASCEIAISNHPALPATRRVLRTLSTDEHGSHQPVLSQRHTIF